MKKLILTGLAMVLIAFSADAQRSKRQDPKKIKKLSLIELEKGKNLYPISYFGGLSRDSLILFSEVTHTNKKVTFKKNKVPLDKFDYIKITNHKERRIKSGIWGAVVGSIFYVVAQRAAYNEPVSALEGFPKAGSRGIVEGLSAAGFGFGIGIIVRNFIYDRKMNIKTQRKEILRKLKDQKTR